MILRRCTVVTLLLLKFLESMCQEDSDDCPARRFGASCRYACHCRGQDSCDRVTGSCPIGQCARGFVGDGCQNANLAIYGHNQQLVDSDHNTCLPVSDDHARSFDLGSSFWVRRFIVFARNTSTESQEFSLHISSHRKIPREMTSSDMRITWWKDGAIHVFLKVPVKGRFVWLRERGLQLCELYIYGGRNVALYRPTFHSSSRSESKTSLAVDGRVFHTLGITGCVSVRDRRKVWLGVNLTATHIITRVVIHFPRIAFFSRPRNFILKAGSGDWNSLSTVYESRGMTDGLTVIVPDKPWSMSLLQIEAITSWRSKLTVCEIQLFGECPDGTYGPSCSKNCNCRDAEEVCDSFSGRCLSGMGGSRTPVTTKVTSRLTTQHGMTDEEDEDLEEEQGSTDNWTEETNVEKTKEKPGTEGEGDHAVTVIVTTVVMITVLVVVAVVVGLVVFRRRNKARLKTSKETQSPAEFFPPAEDDVYEVVDSPLSSKRNFRKAPINNTGCENHINARRKLQQIACTEETRVRQNIGTNSPHTGPAGTFELCSDEARVYENQESSGVGACALGAEGRNVNLYEPLACRDQQPLYTALIPGKNN